MLPDKNDDDVAADRGNLLLNAHLRSGADGHHGDHRGHADDDSEHGQGGPQLIDEQRAKRDLHAGHGFSS